MAALVSALMVQPVQLVLEAVHRPASALPKLVMAVLIDLVGVPLPDGWCTLRAVV